jgi:hypothetical protein
MRKILFLFTLFASIKVVAQVSSMVDYVVNNGTTPAKLLSVYGIYGDINLGASPTVRYVYIGADSDADYSNNNIRFYPDKTASLTKVNNGAGYFLTTPISGGIISQRTPSEALADMGSKPINTGTSTLAAGTVTVSSTAVTATSRITVTVKTPSGTQGFLSVPTRTAGTSFVINSTSATETRVVQYLIIN